MKLLLRTTSRSLRKRRLFYVIGQRVAITKSKRLQYRIKVRKSRRKQLTMSFKKLSLLKRL